MSPELDVAGIEIERRDGKTPMPPRVIIDGFNGVMTVNDVNADDFGEYICTVSYDTHPTMTYSVVVVAGSEFLHALGGE